MISVLFAAGATTADGTSVSAVKSLRAQLAGREESIRRYEATLQRIVSLPVYAERAAAIAASMKLWAEAALKEQG